MIAILADAFVKATVLLLLAAGVTLLLRGSAAPLRHLVWTLACGGVLALPLASALLPNWRVAGWPRLDVPVAFDLNEMPAQRHAAAAATDPTPAAKPAPRAPSSAPSVATDVEPVRWRIRPNWTALVFPVWLSGVAAVLILLAVGMARIAWLDRTTAPLRDERWLLLVEDLSLELGLTRHVRLLQAHGPAMPMTWGIRRPAILLPAEADAWDAERRRDVLLHELAHVKRHDFLIQLIARIACAVYWFHPLAWIAAIAVVVPLAAVAPRVAEPGGAGLSSRIDTIPLVPTPLRTGRRATQPKRLAVVDSLRGCSGETRHSHTSTSIENDDVSISFTLGNCTVKLTSVGKFEFNDDFTDVASLANGGQLVVDVDYGVHDRRLTIRRGSGGTLERTYKEDGDVRPYDADAKRWFTETLTYLFRRTGYMAEARARWILDHK